MRCGALLSSFTAPRPKSSAPHPAELELPRARAERRALRLKSPSQHRIHFYPPLGKGMIHRHQNPSHRPPDPFHRRPCLLDRRPDLLDRCPDLLDRRPCLFHRCPCLFHRRPCLFRRCPGLCHRCPDFLHRRPCLCHRRPGFLPRYPGLSQRHASMEPTHAPMRLILPDFPSPRRGLPRIAVHLPGIPPRKKQITAPIAVSLRQ